ncbi:BZIP transcription factor domain containing protein [Balamuthia mandrillaris]
MDSLEDVVYGGAGQMDNSFKFNTTSDMNAGPFTSFFHTDVVPSQRPGDLSSVSHLQFEPVRLTSPKDEEAASHHHHHHRHLLLSPQAAEAHQYYSPHSSPPVEESPNDFFAPFYGGDFPLDLSVPMHTVPTRAADQGSTQQTAQNNRRNDNGSGVHGATSAPTAAFSMQPQAPLMQVAAQQYTIHKSTSASSSGSGTKRKSPSSSSSTKPLSSGGGRRAAQQQPQQSQPQRQRRAPRQTKQQQQQQQQQQQSTQQYKVEEQQFVVSPVPSSSPRSESNLDAAEEEDQPLDDQEYKRQKRLVKNRQAAQLFRKRQKKYIQDLEEKVAGVNAVNTQLEAKVDVLHSENALLRDQLAYLRTFIDDTLRFAFPTHKVEQMEKEMAAIRAKKEHGMELVDKKQEGSSGSSGGGSEGDQGNDD